MLERACILWLSVQRRTRFTNKTRRRPTSRPVASPGFYVRGHRFGVVKRPKIINVCRTTPRQHCLLLSMRYCIRPVCHSHTIIKWSYTKFLKILIPGINKKLSWCWQTRATRLEAAFEVTNHGTIRCVRYDFLLVCYSNFVPEIFDFKNAVTLKTGLGFHQDHWKYHHIDRAHDFLLMFYTIWLYLVSFLRYSMSTSIATLKSQSGSIKVIENGTIR